MKTQLSSWLLIVLVSLGCFLYGAKNMRTKRAIDFYQFWMVGQVINSTDIRNIYAKADRPRIRAALKARTKSMDVSSPHERQCFRYRRNNLNLAGTPFLYSFFYLISNGNFETDYNNYRLLSLAAYFTGLVIFCHLLRFSIRDSIITILFFALFYWPLKPEIKAVNVNQLQVGLVAVFLLLISHHKSRVFQYLGSLLLGLMCAFKPNLAWIAGLFSLWWYLTQKKSMWPYYFAGFITAAAIAYALPHVYFGSACTWPQWSQSFDSVLFRSNYVQTSFLGLVIDARNIKFHKPLTLLLLIAASSVLVLSRNRFKNAPTLNDMSIAAMGIGVYMIGSPLVHDHYFLLVIPLMLLVFRPADLTMTSNIAATKVRLAAGITGSLLIILLPVFTSYGMFSGRRKEIAFFGVLILLILTLWDFYTRTHSKEPAIA